MNCRQSRRALRATHTVLTNVDMTATASASAAVSAAVSAAASVAISAAASYSASGLVYHAERRFHNSKADRPIVASNFWLSITAVPDVQQQRQHEQPLHQGGGWRGLTGGIKNKAPFATITTLYECNSKETTQATKPSLWKRPRHRPPPRRRQSAARRSSGHGTGGDDGAVYLAMLPLFLITGLLIGYLYSTSSSSTASSGSVTSTTLINVNGSFVNNTSTPTTTTTVTVNGEEVVVERSMPDLDFISGFLALLGTTTGDFMPRFIHSTTGVSPGEAFSQFTTLGRKLLCLEWLKPTSDCADRAVCSHFREDYEVYNGNVLLRAGDIFLYAVNRWIVANGTADGGVAKGSALMSVAARLECDEKYPCEDEDALDQCTKDIF